MKPALAIILAQLLIAGSATGFAVPMAHTTSPMPAFDQLPLNENDPPYSAWGLWGPDDELGRINLITPEVTKSASSEIKTGESVSLK